MSKEADPRPPANRFIDVGDQDSWYTVALSASDLHYLTEVVIMEVDTHGSTRQLLHGSLTGHTAIMEQVFDVAKKAYGHRIETEVGMWVTVRVRLSEAGVGAILAAIRERHGEQTELVQKGMVRLGDRLAKQTGMEWSVSVPKEGDDETERG